VAPITVEQRYQIQALVVAEHTPTEIAKTIGKCKSVVSRELKRQISAPFFTFRVQ